MTRRIVPKRLKFTVACCLVLALFYGVMRTWRKRRLAKKNWMSQWDCGKEGCLPTSALDLSERVQHSDGFLERLRRKIKTKEDVHISIIGGSVTHGTGAHDQEGWAQLTALHLQETFSSKGVKCNVEVSPMPGCSAASFSLCPGFYISNQTDLLIIELAYNSRASVLPEDVDPDMEDIVRYLDPSADVLFLNYGPGVQHLSHSKQAESHIERLARHYNFCVLSWLAAVGFFTTGPPPSGALATSTWLDADQIHPNSNGHRFLAELCLRYLSRLFAVTRSVEIDDSRPQRRSSDMSTLQHAGRCYNADVKTPQNQLPVASSQGFALRSDRPDGSKVGYISNHVGDKLSFSFKLERSSVVSVGHLVSYSKMGSFRVSCSQGCSCRSLDTSIVQYPRLFPYPVVDSFVKCRSFDCLINHVGCNSCLLSERQTSTLEFMKFIAAPVSTSHCHIVIENSLVCESGTPCRENENQKVKIMMLSINPLKLLREEPIVVDSEWINEHRRDQLSGQ